MAQTATNPCDILQKSLAWCEGKPQYAGMRRRVRYIAASHIVKWPEREKAENGVELGSYKESSSFVLAADKKFHYIDIIPAQSKATSEAQGEMPSVTTNNKLELRFPDAGEQGADAAAYINNVPCIFIFEDMMGNMRVSGCERFCGENKNTVALDLGQGAAGTAFSTITTEAPDTTPFPIYRGEIDSDEAAVTEPGA